MGWPNNYVQGVYDATGKVVGIDGIGSLIPSPYEKLARLGAKPVGFNYYSLVYEILLTASGRDTFRPELLSMIQSTGANIVRFALPCFSSAEYLTRVHNTGSMPATVSDSNLRTTYIAAIDTAMDALALYGLKAHVCDSWTQSYLPVALGETVANAYSSTTTETYNYMVSAGEWFFNRYKNHPAFGVYSIGNEWLTDDAGITAPTPVQLGAFLNGVATACRKIDQTKIITSDFTTLTISTLSTRDTMDTFASRLKSTCYGLDAITVHVYPDSCAFVGYQALDNAAFPCSNTNKLGLEGIESVMQCLKSIADSMGKPLIIGEFGINTDHELDANLGKKRKITKEVTKYAAYGLIWNVQDTSIGTGGQLPWFIDSGTTRANSFSTVATEFNLSKPSPNNLTCGGVTALRNDLIPSVSMSSSRVANGTVELTSTAAHQSTNLAVMFWVKLDGDLTAFESILSFVNGSNFNGVVVVGDTVAASNKFYADFRGAAGGAGNISGVLPPLPQGTWHHIAVSWEALEATTVITAWVDGMFWNANNTGGTLTAIVIGTVLKILGSTNGAPVSMQDVALLPSITYDDVIRHMNGEVLPQSMLHVRALQNKTIVDLSRNNAALTVKANVVVNINN